MNRDRVASDEPIDLDPNELLGLSQIAKVSEGLGKPGGLGRVLSKIGPEVPPPPDSARRPLHSRLLSKVGETAPPPVGPGAARLLSKIGTEGPINPQGASLIARLLSKIGGEGTG
jgi:hypothetical protein